MQDELKILNRFKPSKVRRFWTIIEKFVLQKDTWRKTPQRPYL